MSVAVARALLTAARARYKAHPTEAAHDLVKRRLYQLAKAKKQAAVVVDISDDGLARLAKLEGEIPYAYNDSRGFATAWVGHLIAQRPVNDADRRKWGTPQHPASMTEVRAFFRRDLEPYVQAVALVWSKAPKPPTQHQFDACVSLAFNIGTGGFTTSTVAKRIRAGAPPSDVATAFLMWNQPPEIRGRRKHEYDLYLKGA